MNKVILCGRLTRDVEMKDTKSGMQVARVGIAVDRRGKKDEADFFNLVAFNKTAAFILKYLHRGERVLIEGHLQTSSYKKDGVKRTSIHGGNHAHRGSSIPTIFAPDDRASITRKFF